MSMERNELLLALQCCSGADCSECPLRRPISAKCIGNLLREALGELEVDAVALRECAEARTSLAKRLVRAERRLHEAKSELEAAVRGQETLQVYAEDMRLQLEAMEKDLATCIDCCDVCAHSRDEESDCDCECESCLADCPCKDCKNGSKFEWRGLNAER